VKLFVSFVLLLREKGLQETFNDIRSISFMEFFGFLFPGLFYAITNSLDFYILRYMDPGSFQVLAQAKIITTALTWLAVFRKQLSGVKWLALILLMVGSAFVAYPRSHQGASEMYVLPFGLIFLLVQITLSAFAGVCNEFIYKREEVQHYSIHRLNLSMYIWGVLFQVSNYYRNEEAGGAFIDGFNIYTWIVVFIYAFKGLLVSQIFKHYSVIVKLLVNGFSIFVANFFTWYIFGLKTSTSHIIGLLIVSLALFIYNFKDLSDAYYKKEYEKVAQDPADLEMT